MRTRIGILYTGHDNVLRDTISLLSMKFDILLIVDYVPEGVAAVVIPDTEGYNSLSGKVRPYRKIPSNPLAVNNAFLLNFLHYGWGDARLAGVKLVAVGNSALTVGDLAEICVIEELENRLTLAGADVLKDASTYLNVGRLQDCIDEVILFIETKGGDSPVSSNDTKPLPVMGNHNPTPEETDV